MNKNKVYKKMSLDDFIDAKTLLKKNVGIENFELIVAGKQPGYPFNTLNWKKSKFETNKEWIYHQDVPKWAKKLIYPINQNNYRYYLTKEGNLTRYKE